MTSVELETVPERKGGSSVFVPDRIQQDLESRSRYPREGLMEGDLSFSFDL